MVCNVGTLVLMFFGFVWNVGSFAWNMFTCGAMWLYVLLLNVKSALLCGVYGYIVCDIRNIIGNMVCPIHDDGWDF